MILNRASEIDGIEGERRFTLFRFSNMYCAYLGSHTALRWYNPPSEICNFAVSRNRCEVTRTTRLDAPRDVVIEFDPRTFTRFELAVIHEYWNSKRRGRRMPSRADIVPAELTLHLPQILLADVLDEGKEFRYRLLGTRLTPYFPDRATGKTFTEALGPFGAVTVNGTIAVYRSIVNERGAALIKGPGEYYHQDAKMFEAILMPLSDDDSNANMIFGAFEFELKKDAGRARRYSPDSLPPGGS